MRDNSDTWVIHLLKPQAHIQCIEGHHEQIDGHYKFYTFKNSEGVVEDWTLCAQFFFTTDFISEPEKQVIPLLDRAWRWYRSYMEWEEKNIDEDEAATDN